MAIYRQTGTMPDQLANAPMLPVGLEQLWADFTDLHQTRGSNGFGPARITFADIDAWCRVNRATLAGWQVEAIRRADNAYLAHYAEQSKARRN